MMKKELQKELLPRPAEACAYGDAAPHNFAGVTDPATQANRSAKSGRPLSLLNTPGTSPVSDARKRL